MRLPVALELLELLATVNIPQPDRLARPTDKQGGIRWVELDAIDVIAAIFSNVSFTGTTLRLSPPESTPLPRSPKKSLANLWPSSIFRRSPFSGSHRMILLSRPPLARTLPSKRQATDTTKWLPFSQMSGNTYVTAVYASPPLNLRLSPGDRGGNATLRKGGSPMSGESPLAGETRNFSQNAVTCGHIPQECLSVVCGDERRAVL